MSSKARIIAITISLSIFFISCERSVFTGYEEEPPINNYKLSLESTPSNAKIYLNGQNTGYSTPATLSWLKTGKDTITLKLSLYEDTTFVIHNQSEIEKKYFIDFRANSKNYGKIECLTTPTNASIVLDGKKIDFKTPHTIKALEPGNHVVRYSFAEHRDDSMKVEVVASKISYASVTLEDTTQWVSYNSKNSQVQSELVYSITADMNNNIWIGSLDGLTTFDGKRWATYTKSNSMLRTNVINTLLVDNQNRIWIGTTKGIYVIINGILIDYSFNMPDQTVVGIAESKDGTIWTALSGGVAKLTGNSWQLFTISNSGLKDNYPLCIEIDNLDRVWIGSRYYGISIFSNSSWSYISTSSMNISGIESGVNSIGFAEDGTIWVGTIATTADFGRVVYQKNNSWYSYPKNELNYNLVRKIVSHKGNIVFATGRGLGLINKSGNFDFFKSGNTKLHELLLRSVAIDKNDNIWLATFGCGAAKLKRGF